MATYGNYSNTVSATTLLSIAGLSNKILYLDADTTFSGAAHNDPVSSWTDLSGNGYHMLGAGSTRPLVQKTSNLSPNGKVLVRFDGTDDALNSSTPASWPSVAAGYTLYFYGRLKAAASNVALWASDSTGRPKVGYQKGSGAASFVRSEADGTAIKDLHSVSIVSNLMQFFCVVFKVGGTCQAYRAISNGAVTALDQNPTYLFTPVGLSGIAMGDAIGGGPCMMDLAAKLWVSVEHDVTTIGNVRDAMKAVYGED